MTDDVLVVQMPMNQYSDDRKFAFEMLASHAGVRTLGLRVGLSNLFVHMTGIRRKRSIYLTAIENLAKAKVALEQLS